MTPDLPRPPLGPDDIPDPADLAASARLDGDTTFVEEEGLDTDDVARRVAELAQVRSWLSQPVEPPAPDVIDSQMAQALAALDLASDSGTDRQATDLAAPVALSDRRRAHPGRRWIAVAAAVAALALGAAIVATHQPSTSSFDTVAGTTAGPSPASQSEGATSGAAAADQAGSAPTDTAATAPALPDLGAISSEQALTTEIHQVTEPATASHQASSTTVPAIVTTTSSLLTSPPSSIASVELSPLSLSPPCDTELRRDDPSLGVLVYAATAVYKNIPTEVLIYGTPADAPVAYRVVVVRTDTCAVLLDLPY